MLERWTRAVVRWRVLVIGGWVAVAVLGVFANSQLPSLLSTSLAVPGSGSQAADAILARDFGQNVEGSFSVVIPTRDATTSAIDRLSQRLAVAARSVPTGKASAFRPGEGIVWGEVASSLALQQAAGYTGSLRAALIKTGLPEAYVTGPPALQHDLTPVLARDLRRGEIIALLAALVLLVVALGLSFCVLVPFAVAISTISGVLFVVYLLAHRLLLVLYVPNLVELVGLGLAVDYSLLIARRYKEELADESRSADEAIVSTMTSAGRTVMVSAVAVAAGLSVLLVVPVPFIRSLGVAGILVPTTSLAAAVTLQPALLSLLGRPGMRAAVWSRGPSAGGEKLWGHIGRSTVAHPWPAIVLPAVLLLACAAPLMWLQLTPGSVEAIPSRMPSAQGLALLRHGAGPGAITPVEVVVDSGKPLGALEPSVDAATLRLADELVAQPDVFVVAIGTRPPYVDSSGRYRRTVVVERDDFGAPGSQHLVQEIGQHLVPAARFPAGVRIDIGGAPAQGADFLHEVYGSFPWLVCLAASLAYVVLCFAFRSLVVPAVALLLDALSVSAACGLTVALFRSAAGARILGLYHVPQVEGWVPVFLFALLFGLSMDYQVFVVSRIREVWDQGAGARPAIVEGLSHSGPVVSTAALIMVVALSGLALGQVAGLQELGVGLAIGVVLDATIVRGVLMPAVMAVLGPWSWWLPGFISRTGRGEAAILRPGALLDDRDRQVDGRQLVPKGKPGLVALVGEDGQHPERGIGERR